MIQPPPDGPLDAGRPIAGRPAWHPDPAGSDGFECYWDGHRWTDHRRYGDSVERRSAGPAARRPSAGWGPPIEWKLAAAIGLAVLVASVATGLAVLASDSPGRPSPPYSGLVSATCSVDGFTVDAQAYYRSDGDSLELYEFLYRTIGGGQSYGLFDPGPRGEFNNVNLGVITNGHVVFASASPDDRVSGVLYRDPVDLRLNRSRPTYVGFQAIFDVAFGDDPSCVADTPPIPLSAQG
jgi:hypothetical protein